MLRHFSNRKIKINHVRVLLVVASFAFAKWLWVTPAVNKVTLPPVVVVGLGLLLTPNVNISLVIRNLFVLSVRRLTVAGIISATAKRFTQFSAKEKRQAVISAGRCLNCLSTEHVVRDCASRSKCRSCGLQFKIKHATALHACFATEAVRAANREVNDTAPQSVQENDNIEKAVDVRSVGLADVGTVLLRTTAVRVINLNNGHFTLAYAQLDTASQATFISDALREELGLEAVSDPSIKFRTLADQTATCLGRTDFSV